MHYHQRTKSGIRIFLRKPDGVGYTTTLIQGDELKYMLDLAGGNASILSQACKEVAEAATAQAGVTWTQTVIAAAVNLLQTWPIAEAARFAAQNNKTWEHI